MPKYKFIGEESRVFPTLSKELKKGDVFHSNVRIIDKFLLEVSDDEKVTFKFTDSDDSKKSKKEEVKKEIKKEEVKEETKETAKDSSATSADDK